MLGERGEVAGDLDARTAVCMTQHMYLVASGRPGDDVDYMAETPSVMHLP